MIKNTTPLSIAESIEFMEDNKDGETEAKKFAKKFVSLDAKDAKSLRKKLESLDMIKMKPEHLVKILDFLPEDSESLGKIFTDVGLDEDETKKILDIVKEFK